MRLKVWFGLLTLVAAGVTAGCGNGNVIGSAPFATPTPVPTGVTKEIPINVSAAPVDIAEGTDGLLYFTESKVNKIGSYTLTTNAFTQYSPPTIGNGALGIALGPDNDVWFTESLAGKIGTIVSGQVHDYPLAAGSKPAYLTAGPGLFIYVTEPGLNAIGSFSTSSHIGGGPYAIPTANAGPMGIVAGADNNIWFTEYNAAKIGRFNTTTLTVDEEIPLPAGSKNPAFIKLGPDGALWFTENNPAGPKIGRLSTSTGTITEYPLTGAASATSLAVALDNNFYFTDPANNAIGSFNTSSLKAAEYAIPTANSDPSGITIGPNGLLYFCERNTNAIGEFAY